MHTNCQRTLEDDTEGALSDFLANAIVNSNQIRGGRSVCMGSHRRGILGGIRARRVKMRERLGRKAY